MAFSFIPTEQKFFGLFETQAAYSVEAANAFCALAKDWGKQTLSFDPFEKLREIEHEADVTAHEIKDLLNRTFITPFDREDIYRLASDLDDIVDTIESVTTRMRHYHVKQSTEDLAIMADLLVHAAEAVHKAISSLRDKNKLRQLHECCIEVNRIEKAADRHIGLVISKLFEGQPDPLDVMKWKEIYEGIEAAIDTCEDVANTIESIVIKQG